MNPQMQTLTEQYNKIVLITEETRSEFIDLLKNNVLLVTFTKKSGERREMNCTLKPDMLPSVPVDYKPSNKAINPYIVAVWDLDKNEWRSFQVDSVIKYEIV
jgi:WYL_2, Sm-like SH3 beta-barrel fold